MRTKWLLPLLLILLVAGCKKDDYIPPAIERPVEEKPEPAPEPEEQEPEEPAWVDPLHDKEIPAGYGIPTVSIFTESGINSKTEWTQARFEFRDPSGFYTDQTLLEATGRIRGRGNTTWGMPKKPYRIKLDTKEKVFGRWGNRDWILLANYSDKTLLRNIMAMEVSRICEMAWTPNMLSVDVYLNDEYQGVYTFSDHKEIAGHRVASNASRSHGRKEIIWF